MPGHLSNSLGPFLASIYSSRRSETLPAEPACPAHMENGLVIGGAVLFIITLVLLLALLVLLLTLKR